MRVRERRARGEPATVEDTREALLREHERQVELAGGDLERIAVAGEFLEQNLRRLEGLEATAAIDRPGLGEAMRVAAAIGMERRGQPLGPSPHAQRAAAIERQIDQLKRDRPELFEEQIAALEQEKAEIEAEPKETAPSIPPPEPVEALPTSFEGQGQEWLTGVVPDRSGLAAFTVMIRAEEDEAFEPARKDRKLKGMARIKAAKELLAAEPKDWAQRFADLATDGVPRTFNRMMLELTDGLITADNATNTNAEEGLWLAVQEQQLEFRNEAPIMFRRVGEEAAVEPEAPVGFTGIPSRIKDAHGNEYNVRYTLMSVDDARPSHDPQSFQPRASYPTDVKQERNYHLDQAAREYTISYGGRGDLDPETLLDMSQDTKR
jgi:hypothetical protein